MQIDKYIDPIRPNRGAGRRLGSFGGLESFGGTHLVKPEAKVDGQEALAPKEEKVTPDGVAIDSKATQTVLSEYVPLALGRTVDAQITLDNKTISFPLTFRQIPVPMSPKDLERVFDHAKGEDSWQTRFDKLDVGMITTPELLTGRDVIKERFRVRLDDLKANTKYINDSIERQRKHVKIAAATGEMSMNNMANTFVISDNTARQIELVTGKRFDNVSQRESLWQGLRANTIVICNEARGLFTFYTMGVKLPEQYTRNDIKQKAAKESSVGSLADIMKLLNGGM
ncbi:phage capsid and scaffold [Vibrio phage pTD1]|uniref:Phage capsid and scaffold n=1 Tax=Vibrio phage pTD1 TaxID=1938577 RepID=A0A1Q2U2W4_9CAUD|nr:phage capsid and scaffold [Vibrio phage pTD1]BAW98304.1 phage capsid and scaffold [Vibrio phage pTD1]